MCKLKKIKTNTVSAALLMVLALVIGCNSDGSAWLYGDQIKTFKSQGPADDQSLNQQSQQNQNMNSSQSVDPQARQTQQHVNDELERLKRAYEQAKRAEEARQAAQSSFQTAQPYQSQAPMSAGPQDSDSLAAKLSQPGQGYSQPNAKPVAMSTPKEGQSAGERPVITQIKKPTAKITGIEAKGATQKQESVKILNVEPIVREETIEPVKPVSVTVAGKTQNSIAVDTPDVKPANQAIKLNIPDPVGASVSLDKLLRTLEGKLRDKPGDTGTQVKLHLVYAMLGQWKQALKDSGGEDETGGELAKNLAALVKVFDSPNLSSAQQANEAIILLNTLQIIFREQADLVVSNMKLCKEVVSFGCYKKMPDEYFTAGRRLPVIVYLELENFSSKKLKEESYQTLLSLTMELLNSDGKVSWRKHDDKIEDLANKRRRDFYIARLVTLPAGLPADEYNLKVTVEDLNGNKVSQKMLPFNLK